MFEILVVTDKQYFKNEFRFVMTDSVIKSSRLVSNFTNVKRIGSGKNKEGKESAWGMDTKK